MSSENMGRQSAEVRREAIIVAAQEVLGREGVKGFTVKNVAVEAGVSAGLIIYYFGTADRLMQAVLTSIMFDAEDAKSGTPENEREAVLALRRAVDRYFDPGIYSRRSLLLWLPLLEAMVLDESYRQKVEAIDARHIGQIATLIGNVAAYRGLIVDPALVAHNVLSLMDGGWLRWCETNRADTEQEKAAALDYLEMKLGSLAVRQLLAGTGSGEDLWQQRAAP